MAIDLAGQRSISRRSQTANGKCIPNVYTKCTRRAKATATKHTDIARVSARAKIRSRAPRTVLNADLTSDRDLSKTKLQIRNARRARI